MTFIAEAVREKYRMEQEIGAREMAKVTVYRTKSALRKGIVEVFEGCRERNRPPSSGIHNYLYYNGYKMLTFDADDKHTHLTMKDAIVTANSMRLGRIEELEKGLVRMRELAF